MLYPKGKNLLNPKNWKPNRLYDNGFPADKVTVSENGSTITIEKSLNAAMTTQVVSVKPNTNYNLSFTNDAGINAGWYIYPVSGGASIATGTQASLSSFNSGNNYELIVGLYKTNSLNDKLSINFYNAMLEEGTVKTSFEPYKAGNKRAKNGLVINDVNARDVGVLAKDSFPVPTNSRVAIEATVELSDYTSYGFAAGNFANNMSENGQIASGFGVAFRATSAWIAYGINQAGIYQIASISWNTPLNTVFTYKLEYYNGVISLFVNDNFVGSVTTIQEINFKDAKFLVGRWSRVYAQYPFLGTVYNAKYIVNGELVTHYDFTKANYADKAIDRSKYKNDGVINQAKIISKTPSLVPKKNLMPTLDNQKYNDGQTGNQNVVVGNKLAVTSYSSAHFGYGVWVDVEMNKPQTFSTLVEQNLDGIKGLIRIGYSPTTTELAQSDALNGRYSVAFTPTKSRIFVRFSTSNNKALNSPVYFGELQLETGIQTPYEPYLLVNKPSIVDPKKNILLPVWKSIWKTWYNTGLTIEDVSDYSFKLINVRDGVYGVRDVIVPTTVGKTYTFSMDSTDAETYIWGFKSQDGLTYTDNTSNQVFNPAYNKKTFSFVATSPFLAIRFGRRNIGTSYFYNYQLEEGSVQTEFKPYQGINKPAVMFLKKNLVKESDFRNSNNGLASPFTAYGNVDYSISDEVFIPGTKSQRMQYTSSVNGSSNLNKGIRLSFSDKPYSDLKQGKTYVLSWYGKGMENYGYVSLYTYGVSYTSLPKKTLPDGWYRYAFLITLTVTDSNNIYLRPNNNQDYTFDCLINALQIEESTAVSDYELYKLINKPL